MPKNEQESTRLAGDKNDRSKTERRIARNARLVAKEASKSGMAPTKQTHCKECNRRFDHFSWFLPRFLTQDYVGCPHSLV